MINRERYTTMEEKINFPHSGQELMDAIKNAFIVSINPYVIEKITHAPLMWINFAACEYFLRNDDDDYNAVIIRDYLIHLDRGGYLPSLENLS